jgi:outer membrane protein assembly factor BamB
MMLLSKSLRFFTVLVFLYVVLITPSLVYAQQSSEEACNADIDQSGPISGGMYTGSINLSDYMILVRDFLKTSLSNPRSNINQDVQNQVNLSDYMILVKWFLKPVTCPISNAPGTATPAPSISPTFPPSISSSEWNQDAHDAQRTGGTSVEPTEPWSYIWSFNGPDSNGGSGNHLYDAPKEARTVVGNGKIYVPAGTHGLFALNLSDGAKAWSITNRSFPSTPSYDPLTKSIYAGTSEGIIVKIDSNTGTVNAAYDTGSPINKTVLVVGNFVYAVTENGKLFKLNTTTFSPVWTYSSGSRADTPPSYSATRDVIVFASADLNVHAIKNSDGTVKWKVKPSANTPAWNVTFDKGWPVIAEKHGIVFLRLQLPHDVMTAYWDGTTHVFPKTNAETRSWLQNNPKYKNLFALSLDTGAESFIPAVGYGSTEDFDPAKSTVGGAVGVMGSQPVVKVQSDGTEVVYMHFRNGQANPPDYRWDGNMGEMVLDGSTISGLSAGDLRFINMARHSGGVGYTDIIDEQEPITIAGNTLFHAHWGASESVRITDRSATKGLTFTNPISVVKHPTVIRAIKDCGNKNTTTHYTTCNLSYVTDGGRFWDGPGFWVYWNIADPPGWKVGSGNTAGTSYSAGFLPRYTYESNGYIIIEGNGGDITVLKHS